jgi:hypothetical protein
VAIDRPAQPPDRPGSPATPDEPSGDPDPYNVASLTRAQAYESQRGRDRTAPLTDSASGQRDYWGEVAGFFAVWRNHADRWPRYSSRDQERTPAVDLEHVDAADEVIRAENSISRNIRQAAGDCSQPARLGGFEFRLKGADRIKEKVADKLGAEPDRSPAEIVQEMPDAIRYTYLFDTGNYTSGFIDIKSKLEASGYEMYYTKNYWSNSEYKGLNSRWITPEGQRFEVQFHTVESFHAKHEVTHSAYERIRDPRTSEHERSELRSFQRQVARWVPVPGGAQEIPDYKKEGY